MKLKWKIMLPIVLILTVQYSVLIFKDISINREKNKSIIKKIGDIKSEAFFSYLNKSLAKGEMFIDFVLSNKETKKAFAERDRDKLEEINYKLYNKFKKNADIAQFQFHLPSSVSFLRLHNLNKYGDDLSSFRKTVVEANKKKQLEKGIEVGVAGIGIRYVKPVFYNGNSIGTVEYGGKLGDKLLKEFIEETDKKIKEYGLNVSIIAKNLKGEYSVIASNFEDEIAINPNEILSKFTNSSDGYYFSNGRDAFFYEKLKDFSGAVVGYVKFKYDISNILKKGRADTRFSIVIIIVTLISIIVFLLLFIKIVIEKRLNLLVEFIKQVEKGDFRDKNRIKGKDEIGKMSDSINIFIKKLQKIIIDVKSYSGRVSNGIEEFNDTMRQISNSTEEVSESSTTTAASIEELSSTTIEIHQNIERLLKNTENTLQLAKNGGDAVDLTIDEINKIKKLVEVGTEDVKELGNKTNEIGEIVVVIKEIAAQTNLLALNAAIEAARAGEAGKGFEVVAEEVRKLAEKTTEYTKEINNSIKEIQDETNGVITKMEEVNIEVETGVETSNNTGKALEEIVIHTVEVRDMVNSIVNSTREQSIASEDIAKQTEAVAQNSELNGQAIENSSESIGEIAEIAEELNQMVRKFKVNNDENEMGIKKIE
ncbi:methyl-accepting chemotaxis protein [Haliovirga abyssi]|uniref:Methyl-accepting chemotaxis protein n=1 Tax=Haliovirga abyssi TaxID=2996794 RepID=A0AAU9D6D9_9FUSO|nr:methyl-accepting chemotaxis protein [Haliovirga abyssi]BDU51559.1 methyl-accepting chemotaxis protein [Haliovirga abyssi]